MKKELDEEYITLLIDIEKLIINIWKIMIRIKNHQVLNVFKFIWLRNVTKVAYKWVWMDWRYFWIWWKVDKKVIMNKAMKDFFLNSMFNILENYVILFLPERMKIEKVKKLVANIHDETEYVIHIRNLNHGLVLRKVHRMIIFNQKTWLKPYINMKVNLRKAEKKWSLKRLF